ncbi:hypothetical protein PFISCL1PPCAC_6091, partial [Pristionchus fissidentatus]
MHTTTPSALRRSNFTSSVTPSFLSLMEKLSSTDTDEDEPVNFVNGERVVLDTSSFTLPRIESIEEKGRRLSQVETVKSPLRRPSEPRRLSDVKEGVEKKREQPKKKELTPPSSADSFRFGDEIEEEIVEEIIEEMDTPKKTDQPIRGKIENTTVGIVTPAKDTVVQRGPKSTVVDRRTRGTVDRARVLSPPSSSSSSSSSSTSS